MRSLRAATAKAQLASARDRASKNRATSAARAASAFRATASSDARAAAAERPCRSFAKLQASVATPRGSSCDAFWATNAAAAEKRRASASSERAGPAAVGHVLAVPVDRRVGEAATQRLEGRGPLDLCGAERENNGCGVAAAQGVHDARAGVGAALQGVARVSQRGGFVGAAAGRLAPLGRREGPGRCRQFAAGHARGDL